VKKGSKAPLIVALHGLGGTYEAMVRENFHTVDLAEERGYILVAPMGYNTSGWYGVPLTANPTPELARQSEYSEQDVMDVLALVRQEFAVDADRIYLMGHSMGGAGTLYLGIKYPSLWAALAPIAPATGNRLDPAALASIRSMPVIIVQGEADTAVPVAGTRRWVEKLKELGMRYKYDEFAGGTHMGVIGPGMADIFAFFDAASKAAH
jgi:predicted peptidase